MLYYNHKARAKEINMTVMGMTKNEYVSWYMDAYKCNEAKALNSWNFYTSKKEEKPLDEVFEEVRNAILY